jgi:hypothetical protein
VSAPALAARLPEPTKARLVALGQRSRIGLIQADVIFLQQPCRRGKLHRYSLPLENPSLVPVRMNTPPAPRVKRTLCVFTIVQDEPEFIHPWINHYKKHVEDPRDLFVLVHPPTYPGGQPARSGDLEAWHRAERLMAEHHGVTLLPVHRSLAFDHRWLTDTVAKFQSFLLNSFTWVLFAEADEFVLPMPGPASSARTLLDLVQQLAEGQPPAIRATGFEIVQQQDEPPIAPELYDGGANVHLTAADLVEGRRFWYQAGLYSKTVLANVPLRWEVGFHRTDKVEQDIATGPPSGALALVHLHRVDFDLALGRARRSRARRWSRRDFVLGLGAQNRIGEASELRAVWDKDNDTGEPLTTGRLQPIAEGLKEALR